MKSNIDIVRDYLKGDRPITIVGYQTPAEQKRLVGEKWTDAKGREWVQKESGPVRVGKLDAIREELIEKCSCCGAEIRWGTRHDRTFYHKTGKCFDCIIKEETMLRIKGHYHLYEQKKVLKNQLAYLTDIRKKLKEAHDYAKDHKEITFVNSNGFLETWENDARHDLLVNIKKDFRECLKAIRRAETSIKELDKKIEQKISETEPAVVL